MCEIYPRRIRKHQPIIERFSLTYNRFCNIEYLTRRSCTYGFSFPKSIYSSWSFYNISYNTSDRERTCYSWVGTRIAYLIPCHVTVSHEYKVVFTPTSSKSNYSDYFLIVPTSNSPLLYFIVLCESCTRIEACFDCLTIIEIPVSYCFTGFR